MCGLTGYLGRPDEAVLRSMTDAIRHRGPDADGHWSDADAGVALGHRRLSIVDLSEAGAQPMTSHSGRYVMVYNGEIYDHADMRAALEAEGRAPDWRGHSDSETLMAGFDAWGIEATVLRATGMFAIAVWDRADRRLTLIRDRMGEKPLHYGWQGGGDARAFLFGSELGALARHPAFEGRIRRDVLPELLRHGHVAEDRCIYEGISKVLPGGIVEVGSDGTVTTRRYWDAAKVAATRAGRPFDGTPEEAAAAFDALLKTAVSRQMMADVPLGAFLSGGIDSSTIVALMQEVATGPVSTFSIGFPEKRYDEAEHARAVAAHLGTDHTDLYVDEATLLAVVPELASIYDEPQADSSQIPTYLVARLARRHVTVALSGDGGDELFSGYDRYRQGAALMARLGRLPLPLRRVLAAGVRGLPTGAYDRLLDPLRPTPQGKEHNGQRMHRLADYLASDGVDDLHRKLVSRWRFPEAAVPGVIPAPTNLDAHLPPRGDLSDIERMMQLDQSNYLPDDILMKVDRATMAVSLESRAPLLDHHIAEFAWSLPLAIKRHEGLSKWPLRQSLYARVPRAIVDRPKMGFEVPIGLWLRGPLRDWAEDLLAPARLSTHFDPAPIRAIWEAHLAGRANWGLQLWPVLMFESWRQGGGAEVGD